MATPVSAMSCLGRLMRTPGSALPPIAAQFSTSATLGARAKRNKRRDNNRFRGVSPLRRTGLRNPVSVSNEPLPRPRMGAPEIQVDPNHGLYGFFAGPDKLMNTPAEDGQHGRAWTVEELRRKSWEDLHKLWWVCCRERNKISTADIERKRAKMGFGSSESNKRDAEVKTTMKAIKHVLTERYYLWEDAYELAQEDKDIDLSGEGDAYSPMEDGGIFEEDVPPNNEATSTKAPPA